jgi:hypothetical protein
MPEELAIAIYKNANIIDDIRIATPSGLIASKLGRFKLQDQADIEALMKIGKIDLSLYPLPKEWADNFQKMKHIAGN